MFLNGAELVRSMRGATCLQTKQRDNSAISAGEPFAVHSSWGLKNGLWGLRNICIGLNHVCKSTTGCLNKVKST